MVTLRSAGVKVEGTIVKGPPGEISAKGQKIVRKQARVAASIPSKYETTVNIGSREVKAFGSRASRFGTRNTDLPGPGSYYNASSFIRTQETCGSVSHRGYGVGFVSKTKRFQTPNEEEIEYESTPGPGAYNSHKRSPWNSKGFSKASASRIFLQSQNKVKGPDKTPGPGEYSSHQTKPKITNRGKGTFGSTTKRGFSPNIEGPAPGAYHAPLKYTKNESLESAAFKSESKRGKGLVVPGLHETPGPGAYSDVNQVDTKEQNQEQHPSSVFANVCQDRFGNAYIRRVLRQENPGPGTYSLSSNIAKEGKTIKSSFISKTARCEGERGFKPPGPAYYKPQKLGGKRSFMLNATRKWV